MGSPLRIEIKDFQSLKHVNLELVDGVNIITGKTNQGKSAVIRAIDAALFNMGDDSMIRGGKRYSGVSIDNGRHKMVFCRDGLGKNEKTAYQFDDNPVQKKVGRSQLPEVAQMFNVRDVRMQNNTKMKLNFWYQNEKPFLMDKTPGQLYEFLSLSSCDKYTKILKKMIVDMKVQEADINNITTEIDTLKVINNKKTDFIFKNEGFDDLYVKIITADQEDKKLQNILASIKRVYDLISRIGECKKRLAIVSDRYKAIPIDTLSSQYDVVVVKASNVQVIGSDISKVSFCANKVANVRTELSSVVVSEEEASKVLSDTQSRLDAIISDSSKCLGIENIMKFCGDSYVLCKNARDKMEKISAKSIPNLDEVSSKIERISESNNDVRDISAMLFKISNVRDDVESKRKDLSDTSTKLDNTEAELEEIKRTSGYCPFCGTVFGEEHKHE